MRLQSDMLLARDPRTACDWQVNVNNQELMTNNFKAAMEKLAVTGQDTRKLVDCSEAVPPATPAVKKAATFPAGTGPRDLQQACPLPFPALKTDRKSSCIINEPYSLMRTLHSWCAHSHPGMPRWTRGRR